MEMVSIEVRKKLRCFRFFKNGTENTNYEQINWSMKRERNEKRVKKATERVNKKTFSEEQGTREEENVVLFGGYFF